MEQWLRKVEDGTSRFFRWTPAGAVAQRAESTSAPPACSAASGLDPQDNEALIARRLRRSLSHSFLEDRTTIQLLRQSQTQVCCMLSVPGDKAVQEGLEQMANRMSQLALQAKPDTVPHTEPSADAQVLLLSRD